MPIDLNKAAKAPAPRVFIPSTDQQAYFDYVSDPKGGNAVLVAVAGAGKTTTILEGMALMQGRVWLGVYNKKMADEIKGKISRHYALRERSGLYAATFHSAGYSALRFAYARNFKLDISDKKVTHILRNMAMEHPPVTFYHSAALACVSMAKNRGIGPVTPDTDEVWQDMIANYDLARTLPEETTLADLIDISREALRRSNEDLNTIDFDDMVYLPLVRKLKMLQHEWVIVDEAQDTNPTRRALAAKLLAPGGRFVAVGDPRQAIFGFTGADNDSLKQLADKFQCHTLPLTVTYRCPKAVVAVARQFVSHITAHDSAPDGVYRQIEELDFAEEVKAWDPRDYADTAILCRTNAPLVRLCFALIKNDIPAKIEGRDVAAGLVALATRWKISSLNSFLEKLAEYMAKEVAKAKKDENEGRIARLGDEHETMKILVANTKRKGGYTVNDLVRTIEDMFSDDVSGKGVVTLCSAHKSKGLEWKRVYLYGRNLYMPSKWARKDWEVEQEENLIYVALTRSMSELVEVHAVEPKKEEDQ